MPISILLGCIILGGFYYASQVNKQQSIEKQEQIKIGKDTNAEGLATSTSLVATNSNGVNNISDLYPVAQVVDGDTIKVDIDGKIITLRLIGIDTPETVDPRKPVQCFAREASNRAKEILSGKKVRLEADKSQGELDKYNRLLRYVFLEDGTFYNKIIIAEGYAHEYTYQSNPYKYQIEFKQAETEAREGKRGLWSADTCNGDTTQPANTQASTTDATPAINEPQVKKSTTGICHEKGSTYYYKTANFLPFNSIEECLDSGGRLPKR